MMIVPMENVAMPTKMEDVWDWLGVSRFRNSEITLASLGIPVKNSIDNFQGAMKLIPQEILQFDEILARNNNATVKLVV